MSGHTAQGSNFRSFTLPVAYPVKILLKFYDTHFLKLSDGQAQLLANVTVILLIRNPIG